MASKDELKAWQAWAGATPDGEPGPKTFEATVAKLNALGLIATRPMGHTPGTILAPTPAVALAPSRADVVAWALSQVGERTKDEVRQYARICAPDFVTEDPSKYSWCGIFWLAALTVVGCKVPTWKRGSGFAYGYLPTVSIPEPGDGMYFGGSLHHYAVVERVERGRVFTIEGNTYTAPTEGVRRRDHALDAVKSGGGCYFSIRNLVR
jgi:hypothetical protein